MGFETEKEKLERFLNGLVSESEDLEEYFLGKDPRKTKYYKRNKGKWASGVMILRQTSKQLKK